MNYGVFLENSRLPPYWMAIFKKQHCGNAFDLEFFGQTRVFINIYLYNFYVIAEFLLYFL